VEGVDKDQFAEFLRHRRERLSPTEVGAPVSSRRRTPGLRREEVAVLAAVSLDYYRRLEQGRGPHPSRQVLAGIGRALRLDGMELAHLYRLAGELPPREDASAQVSPGVLQLLERLNGVPALVVDATYAVLAANELASTLVPDLDVEPNLARLIFLHRERLGDRYAAEVVADLRAALGRRPDDSGLRELVAELVSGSKEFAIMWADHEVGPQRTSCVEIDHPVVGELILCCEALLLPDRDQRLLIYTAAPDSPSAEALGRLEPKSSAGRSAGRLRSRLNSPAGRPAVALRM
jgi:hypothetical protein